MRRHFNKLNSLGFKYQLSDEAKLPRAIASNLDFFVLQLPRRVDVT
jgi:hypothetical protein